MEEDTRLEVGLERTIIIKTCKTTKLLLIESVHCSWRTGRLLRGRFNRLISAIRGDTTNQNIRRTTKHILFQK